MPYSEKTKKNMQKKCRRLDGDVHTKQELRLRSVEGEGGLCALAGFYQALYHTFLSRLVMLMTLMMPTEESINIHKVTFKVSTDGAKLPKYEKSSLGEDRRGQE